MADVVQIRRDTAAAWTSANPTLANGEQGYETDTGKIKIGDGSTTWTALSYFSAVGGATGRCATVTIAANDSSALDKAQADYLCTGTGDQTIIQTAITAAGAGEAHFLKGTYNFAGFVTSVAGVTIAGHGATFFLSNGANGQLIKVAHDGVTIKDIIMDGNGISQTGGTGLIEVTANSDDLTVTHIHFKNAWNAGLYAVGSIGSNRVDNLMMSHCVGEDFHNGVEHTCALAHVSWANNVQIDNCRVDNFMYNTNHVDGVKVIHATNVQISNLIINNITGHGIFVGYGSEDVQISNVIFTNDADYTLESICVEFAADGITNGTGRNKRVTIDNVSHYATKGGNNGFYLDTCDDLLISNCAVELQTVAWVNPAFRLDYIENGKMSNCVARGLIGDDCVAFRIEHSKDVSLLGCDVIDAPVWAWTNAPRAGAEVMTSENTSFVGCTFKDLATSGIRVASSTVFISACVFENLGLYAGFSAWGIHAFPNHNDILIRDNAFIVGSGGYTKGVELESNNDRCTIMDNTFRALVTAFYTGAGCDNLMIRNNTEYITESSGTATLLSATTSIAVTHGLSGTPAAGDIVVVPMETWGNMTKFWIDTYTSTQFTIHSDIAPGADTDFAWKAIVL